MMPIHWGAFNLSLHEWTDPILRARKEAERLNVNLINPFIGETFVVGQQFPDTKWWELDDQGKVVAFSQSKEVLTADL